MGGSRGKALVIATYEYEDPGLRGLTAPGRDAEALAAVLADPDIAGLDVTQLVNEPSWVVAEAIDDFYSACRRDELTVLYFSGHGVKDDHGALYLAMRNTRRQRLRSTGLSAGHLSAAMDDCPSRRKVLVLDCCYSGAFPSGRTAKADEGVHTLERFQGKGRVVLTASDSTQYAFEGDDVRGSGTSSLFTRYLVEGIRTGAADADQDGDIALDELYGYVHERVVADMPQQRPKKQEDVDGRILIARNVHWTLPAHLRHAMDSPIAAQRLAAVEGLGHLHRAGNDVVRAAVAERLATLADDDSRSVAAAAAAQLERSGAAPAAAPVPGPRGPETSHMPVAARAVPPTPVARPDPPPVRAAPLPEDPPAAPPAAATGPPAVTTAPAPQPASRWSVPAVVLALVLVGALPLTLSRLLAFESSVPFTSDELAESSGQWRLLVVAPLAVAAGMLAIRSRIGPLLPAALGLVTGAGLTLVEHAGFWTFWFIDNADGYDVGPALVLLVVGAALVAAAAWVAVTRLPLAGRPTVRADWRVACALAVVTAAVLSLAYGPETYTVPGWIAASLGTLLLAAVALPLTLLRLRADQRLAALVAVTVFGAWSVWFPISELVADSPVLGLEPSVWVARVAGVVLTLLACGAAQAGSTSTAATSPAPR